MSRLAAALAAFVLPAAAMAAPESYTIDPFHTYPHFTVSHLGFSTMHGRFDSTSGKIVLDRAARTGSVEITIDAASITTGDARRPDGTARRAPALAGLFQRGRISQDHFQIHQGEFQGQ